MQKITAIEKIQSRILRILFRIGVFGLLKLFVSSNSIKMRNSLPAFITLSGKNKQLGFYNFS
ncbi:hypothetical protein CNR22_09930 [Sphingobacteriaceae bacterium]|nr:hypothetical protein CNR22_09930 [Sphingobacteriaceae bacterium]